MGKHNVTLSLSEETMKTLNVTLTKSKVANVNYLVTHNDETKTVEVIKNVL